MKKVMIIIFSLIFFILFAEDFYSLKTGLNDQSLSTIKRIDLLLKVIKSGGKIEPDSLLVFGEEAYFLAKENEYKLRQTRAAIALADLFQRKRDLVSAGQYLDTASILARRGDFFTETGKIHFLRSVNYIYQSEFEKAHQELILAEEFIEYLNSKTIMRIYNNIANILYYYSDYAPALDYYLKQKTIAQTENDKLEMGFAYTGIGNIYNNLGDFIQAEENYIHALEELEESIKPQIAYSIKGNLASIYTNTNQVQKARKLNNEFLNKAIELNDLENIYIAYNNFGVIEKNVEKNYTKALSYFNTALDFAESYGDKYNIATAQMNIGATYLDLKEYKKAGDHLIKAIQLSNSIPVYEISTKAINYMLQLKATTVSDPEISKLLFQYLEFHKKLAVDNTVGVMEINKKYSQQMFDQKMEDIQIKNTLAENEIKHQKIVLVIIIVFLLILTVAFIFLVSLNIKLRNLRDSLQQKVDISVNQIRQQDSLLIMQNHQAAMGEMISMIAHQWKQPLNSIGLIVQNIEDAYKFDELSEEFIDRSVKDTLQLINFMSNTINSFRNYFIVGKNEIFTVAQVVDLSLDYTKVVLKRFEITPRLDIQENISIHGQINLMVQVFLILINNSRDAFLEKDVSPRFIDLSAFIDDDHMVSIIYQDNAGGIDEGIISRIFESYFTTKKDTEGTGIGLYIARSIINQRFNGTISVENTVSGCRFFMKIPSDS